MSISDNAFSRYIEKASKVEPAPRWLYWRHAQALKQIVPHLLLRAGQARAKAISYRGFKVGSAVFAYRPDWEKFLCPGYAQRYRVFEGFNIKRKKTDGLEVSPHSEQMAISAAMNAGYTLILAVCVVGPVQADDATGVAGPTLRPCASCRALLQQAEVVRNKTLVITASPDEAQVEIHTRRELLNLF